MNSYFPLINFGLQLLWVTKDPGLQLLFNQRKARSCFTQVNHPRVSLHQINVSNNDVVGTEPLLTGIQDNYLSNPYVLKG